MSFQCKHENEWLLKIQKKEGVAKWKVPDHALHKVILMFKKF